MPFVFDDKDPKRITELDYVQIGKALHGGYVEALGSGFYAIAGRYTHEDLTAFLTTSGHVPVYVTHVTYTDGTGEDYTGSVAATLLWIKTRSGNPHQVIASFTTGRVIAEDTEQGIRDRIKEATS